LQESNFVKSIAALIFLTTALAATTAVAEPIRIANIGHGYYAGPLYVAVEEKLFEKYGLEPDITVVQSGPLVLQSLLTKQVDVGVVSYEHVLSAAVQGQRIVSFYNIAIRPLNNLVVDAAIAEGSDKLSLDEKIRRLKGKRVGLPSANGSGEKMLKFLASRHGLKLPGDISTIYLGGEPASYVAAFRRKIIDAALPVEPAGVLVQRAGTGSIYIDVLSGDVPEFRDVIFMTLSAHPDTMRERPDLLRKVAQVFTEANRILLDPNRGKALMAKMYPDMDAETNDKAYAALRQVWPESGHMTDAEAQASFDYLQPEGPQKINLSTTYTNDFLPKQDTK
jgi:NitT/TauT family transport system substrate-binding protein